MGERLSKRNGFFNTGGGLSSSGGVGKKNFSLTHDFGRVKGCIDDCASGALTKMFSVEKEGNSLLFGGCGIFLPVRKTVGLFFAASVGTSGRDRLAKPFEEFESKGVGRDTNPEGTSCGFETRVNTVRRV